MAQKSRKVLVTGGAGFIGSRVAEAHLERGDRVWVVDDLSSGRLEHVPSAVEFHRLDVASAGVAELIERVAFDVINHHAAQVDVASSVADPVADARTNVLGLLRVLEAARRAGCARVVFASSGGAIYGDAAARPTEETAPKRPLSPYGIAKLAGERYLRHYRKARGLDSVALRYANVYGPRQGARGEGGVVAAFSRRLLAGRPLDVRGDGRQTRDYVFVDDVARVNVLAAEAPLPARDGLDDRAFNVGTGIETSVLELAEEMEAVAGLRPGRTSRAAGAGEVRFSALAIGRVARWGWAPSTTLRAGLEATLEFHRARAPAVACA